MAYRQKKTPNINTPAQRGWCLKYVDDCVSAPNNMRQPHAQATFNVENKNGNIRAGDPPVGIWAPIFFSLSKGVYAGLGHCAWAFNHGNGWIEIHDTETQTGARPVYRNIQEVLNWFGQHGIAYLGWSLWVDGVHAVEEYTLEQPSQPQSGQKSGKATVLVDVLNVRSASNTESQVVAQYLKGQSFNYDSYVTEDGYLWLSYISFSGVRRYVAQKPINGDNYVSGGV